MADIAQLPGVLNIALVAGDRFNFSITLCHAQVDGDGNPVLDVSGNPIPDEGNPIDLTDATIEAQIRRRAADSEIIATILNVNSATLGASGEAQMRITEEESAKLRTVAASVWDLQVSWADARGPQTLLTGAVAASMDVTR